MTERWIVIPNWERYQHRDAARVEVPTWIKLYTELLSKEEFRALTMRRRGILVCLWAEYARSRRRLTSDTRALTHRLGERVTSADLEALNHASFIEFSASRDASRDASKHASLEKRREEEKREEPTGRQAVASYAEVDFRTADVLPAWPD